MRVFLALLVIGVGVGAAAWFYLNPVRTEKTSQREKRQVYVTTMPVSFGDYPVKIEVMGQVSPAREIILRAQVSGEVIAVSEHFTPGGIVAKGEEILKLDPADYALAVQSKEAALEQAQATYRLEEGQQQIARNEIELLQRKSGQTLKRTDLALRKPQLAQAKANLEAAQVALELAELDLERTALKAWFDAIIVERNTNIGNIVSAHSQLARLVATDEYWVNIDIPLSDLPWIVFPDQDTGAPGTKAVITLNHGRGERDGEVFRQTGSVDQKSRLAGLIVRVPNPLLLDENGARSNDIDALILGDYVSVTLVGKTLADTARIPQQYLRKGDNGDEVVWLEQRGRLVIQPVTVAYRDRTYAYITEGLEYATKLVTSNIITPIAGMELSVRNGEAQ
ncbi:MAG: efflux RND transporter periplasmic adaptor subunit [Alphaproteobacteria bacterium]